ncbi:MAG: ImmA/IrrE family metallo-endopeptidase [Candidatus Solibacter usitatus]|nr:ImmA/IrrE family metallo-endopeptidase [Candidatus Solibacter usitatus]
MSSLNPAILTWARTTAGLSLEEGARAIGLKDAYGLAGAELLDVLERGENEPSRPLLVKMSKAYRRPLLVFYLAAPPKSGDRGQDFRTVPGAAPPLFDPDLDALLRDIKARHSIVKSLQEDLEAGPVPFIGSVSMDIPVEELAERIVRNLNFGVEEFHQARTIESAFFYLRSKIEEAGVFVLLAGNLGSHHTNIPADTFRGFAIADPVAPFILVNDQDAKQAWAFTALHELVHLWLGTTGVSGGNADAKIERFCNDVAGEILLPSQNMDGLPAEMARSTLDKAIAHISEFAHSRNVSRGMAAYRAYRAGIISEAMWIRLSDHFKQEWIASKAKLSQKPKQTQGGPSYYVVRRHRIGAALLELVSNSLRDGNITYTKAGKVLGVKPMNVDLLLRSTAGVR